MPKVSESSGSESESSDHDPESTEDEDLLDTNRFELQTIALDAIAQKVKTLEERFKLMQEMMMDDSAYQSDVTDLKSWLAGMETRTDPFADIPVTPATEEAGSASEKESEKNVNELKETKPPSPVQSKKDTSAPPPAPAPEKKRRKKMPAVKAQEEVKPSMSDETVQRHMKYEEDIMHIFTGEGEIEVVEDDTPSPAFVGDLSVTNNKIKTLAVVLNDQLKEVRDKIFTLDHDLKRMARGVEFALLRSKVAGMNDLVSVLSFLSLNSLFHTFYG